jgi:hypothetical protein
MNWLLVLDAFKPNDRIQYKKKLKNKIINKSINNIPYYSKRLHRKEFLKLSFTPMKNLWNNYKSSERKCDFIANILDEKYNCRNGEFCEDKSSGIFRILNDYVSNLPKGRKSTEVTWLIDLIFKYATQFNHPNILKVLRMHIPPQLFCDDILREIFEAVCGLSLNFPELLLVNKKSNAIVTNFLLSFKRDVKQQLDVIKITSSCADCGNCGLLKRTKYGSICVNNCDRYCENRDCEIFGDVCPGAWINPEEPKYCDRCEEPSMVIKKYGKEICCKQHIEWAPEYAKCKRPLTYAESGSWYIDFDVKYHACRKCVREYKDQYSYGFLDSDDSEDYY